MRRSARSPTSRCWRRACPRSASASPVGPSTNSLAMAEGKRPLFSSKTLAQSAFTQVELSRAEAARRAGAGVPPRRGRADVGARAHRRPGGRCGASRASASPPRTPPSTAAEVADRMFTLAGGSSVYTSNVLQRCMPRRPHPDPAPASGAQAARDAGPHPPRPGRRHAHAVTRSVRQNRLTTIDSYGQVGFTARGPPGSACRTVGRGAGRPGRSRESPPPRTPRCAGAPRPPSRPRRPRR